MSTINAFGVAVTYQEQRVGQESVQEDGPTDPATGALAAVEYLSDGNGHDDADKLITRVRNEIEELGLAGDAQEIASKLEGNDFHQNNGEACSSCYSQQLWFEIALEAGDECGEEDIGDEGHDCIIR